MQNHLDKIENHVFHVNRTSVINLIEAICQSDKISDEQKFSLNRIRNILQFMGECFDNSIKEFISIGLLDAINTNIQNIINNLNSYSTNQNVASLTNIDSFLAEILSIFFLAIL